jgi:hypothetical protein
MLSLFGVISRNRVFLLQIACRVETGQTALKPMLFVWKFLGAGLLSAIRHFAMCKRAFLRFAICNVSSMLDVAQMKGLPLKAAIYPTAQIWLIKTHENKHSIQ